MQTSGKSVAHASIQRYLKKQIPSLELEKKVDKRRGDAVWEAKKIVFEIQLSPITLEEAQQRCHDYLSAGYQIVWILHAGIFNDKKASPAERFLRKSFPTYFTNGDSIYDQVEVFRGRYRFFKGDPLPVQITAPCTPFIEVPQCQWPLHFVGDIHTLCATQGVGEIRKIQKKYALPTGIKYGLQWIGFRILELVSTPSDYFILFFFPFLIGTSSYR